MPRPLAEQLAHARVYRALVAGDLVIIEALVPLIESRWLGWGGYPGPREDVEGIVGAWRTLREQAGILREGRARLLEELDALLAEYDGPRPDRKER